MHIDLNSCFATAEQQANPLLRGKPVAVAAYTSLNGCILSPSYEAKRFGVKAGMRVRDAKFLCPKIIVMAPDPPKYRDIHIRFSHLFRQYSPSVTPKSIDEAVLDFTNTLALGEGLVKIGREIKGRIKKEIGEWISCNIGIGTNRFLAKLAASLHKPDGLDVISCKNLHDVYSHVTLTDLNGINARFQARLNACNIFTPLEFLEASLDILQKQVFKSICGYYWYMRLRGWEVDAIDFGRKSYGQTYSLKKPTADSRQLAPMLMKLCEKMGRRLRCSKHKAMGIHVACLYTDHTHWHQGKMMHSPMYTTQELYQKAWLVFNYRLNKKPIANIAVSCYSLTNMESGQLELFDSGVDKQRKLSDAIDQVNDKYGEYIITPALMMGMQDLIIDRVAFGGAKELEDLYTGGKN